MNKWLGVVLAGLLCVAASVAVAQSAEQTAKAKALTGFKVFGTSSVIKVDGATISGPIGTTTKWDEYVQAALNVNGLQTERSNPQDEKQLGLALEVSSRKVADNTFIADVKLVARAWATVKVSGVLTPVTVWDSTQSVVTNLDDLPSTITASVDKVVADFVSLATVAKTMDAIKTFVVSDEEGGEVNKSSLSKDAVKFTVKLGLDVSDGSNVVGSWYCDRAEAFGISSPTQIDQDVLLTIKRGVNTATFTVSRPINGWPVGDYHFEVKIDGHFARRIDFKVA